METLVCMLTSCDVGGVVRIEYVARWKVSIAVKDMNDAKFSFFLLRFKVCVFARADWHIYDYYVDDRITLG